VAPFLHLPVQSGSDAVLRRMRREYTAAQYLERLGYLGGGPADLCLSTDFIVGFPGETDADFEATMALLDQVRFDQSFSFVYSPRPGTPALRLKDDLPRAVKQERLARLQARQQELTLASNLKMVGRVLPARIETETALDGGHWLARTANWKNVHLTVPAGCAPPFRELVEVRVTGAGPHFLRADVA
jgi:tRNA-2-methylthio-N6-dimethylallyladenosine synthase